MLQVDLILDTDKTSMQSTSRNAPKDDKDDKATLHDAPNDPAPSNAPAPALTDKEAANVLSTPVSQTMSPKEESPVREDVSSKQEARDPAPILPPSSNVMPSSVSKSLPNTSQKETRATQQTKQQDSTFAFSDRLATIPSKRDSTAALAGTASTLSSPPILPPSPAPASASTLTQGASAGTATVQEVPAAPSESALLGNSSGNTISESQPLGGTTDTIDTNIYTNNTYTNIKNGNTGEGLGQPPVAALANSQIVTNQISVNQAGPNQVSPDQSSVGEGYPVLDSKPADAQSPTKPESHIASAQEILDFLSEQLSTKKTYPDAARQRHIEGKVRVGMSIAADGSLASVRVLGKSGSTILDRAAVTLVTELFPLSRQLEKALDVAVTIEYKLVK